MTVVCLPLCSSPACDYVATAKATGVDYCIAEPGSWGRKGYKKGTPCIGSRNLDPDNT